MHTYVGVDRLHQDLKDKVIVSPLRDPKRVWESWEKRVGTVWETPPEHFERAWAKLVMLDNLYDITYIPIDREARDAQWAFLEQRLNEKVPIDWSCREGHLEGSTGLPRDLWWVYELPMVKRFYKG